MGFMDDFIESLAKQTAGVLPAAAQHRLVAAYAAKTALPPNGDTVDQLRLANYINTGSGEFPDQEELQRIEVRNLAGESQATPATPPLTVRFPYMEGEHHILGPGIASNTVDPGPDTVINWRGENFVPQQVPSILTPSELDGPAEREPDQVEPAPMAGSHWQGHRGRSG